MGHAVIIGAGPAGLMAADVLSEKGHEVSLLDAMATPARKFLMAGKSGLNLTKDEGQEAYLAAFRSADFLKDALIAFDNRAVMDFAKGLGVDLFTGTTGRVFPVELKASNLLRRWLTRLDAQGVRLLTRHVVRDLAPGQVTATTPAGEVKITCDCVIVATGGASWPKLGSDGAMLNLLASKGVAVTPFSPSNVGLAMTWSPHMSAHIGTWLKNLRLTAGPVESRGEIVLTKGGIEGGGIYPLSAEIARGAEVVIDLLPDLSPAEVAAKLARQKPSDSLSNRLRKALSLEAAKIALFHELTKGVANPSPKHLILRHQGLQGIERAISSAGGIAPEALSDGLMLKALPGVYAAGEILGFDAPTGGYLISACLASGRFAAQAAAGQLAMAATASSAVST